MSTVSTSNFGGYTKKALMKADLLVNVKKFYKLFEPSDKAQSARGEGTDPGAKPEFDRIDPITRSILKKELEDMFDASNNAAFGTTDLDK